ncbi:MAG: Hpt domain-containing protein [Alphaproteobacteria bacterium]|nr:Hpt domain-containing protein [Alphaproteobacteria bacterium]MBF0251877.1 Hpt domain-containing protein [Alphaproteobacteria bacterium]
MSEDETKNVAPQVIKPPMTLQAKVEKGGPGAVDLKALEKAESVIANLADEYLKWVQEDFLRLEKAFNVLKSGEGDVTQNLDNIFQIAHDMKGQGGSFGYDLMTAIGDQLCRLVEKMTKAGPREQEMIRVHIDAMRVIITKNLKGDGGNEGRQLLMGLQLVSGKL